jgi:hypothetical protein
MKPSFKRAVLGALLLAATLGFTAAVQAKPAPLDNIDTPPTPVAFEDSTVDSGPSGAMLESSYFNAQQAPFTAQRLFPCRVQVRMFDKTRLAQMCK